MAFDQQILEAVGLCYSALEWDRILKQLRTFLGRPLKREEAQNLLRFLVARMPELDADAVRTALLGERRKRGRQAGHKVQKSSKLLGPYYQLWRKGMRRMEFYREWIPADRQSPIERREYFRNTLRRTFQRWDKDPAMAGAAAKDATTPPPTTPRKPQRFSKKQLVLARRTPPPPPDAVVN